MTVNDITFRSQGQAFENRRFYEGLGADAKARMGDTIQGFGRFLVENQRYERELAMRQGAMEREFAMQKAEADMRLALHQQELQSNQWKLQQMAAMDAVDLGKMQVESSKLDLEMRRYEFDRRKEMADFDKETKLKEMNARLMSAMGGQRGAVASGWDLDPTSGQWSKLSEEDVALKLPRLDSVYGASGVSAETEERRNLASLVTTLDKVQEVIDSTKKGSQEHQTALATKERIMKLLPQSSSSTTASQASQLKQGDVESLASRIRLSDDGEIGQVQPSMMESVNRLSIARWMLVNADTMAAEQQAGFDQDPARKGRKATRDSVQQDLLQILNSPSDPRRQALLARLRQLGVIH